MHYLDLLKEAEDNGVSVHEFEFKGNLKGLYVDNTIAISNKLKTTAEKKCILAEELGHHHINHGDILDPHKVNSIKQESKGKAWGIERLISLEDIIYCRLKNGVRNVFELASELMVTEDFLTESLAYYKSKYGTYVIVGKHTLNLDTLEIFDNVASNELELHRYIKKYKNNK